MVTSLPWLVYGSGAVGTAVAEMLAERQLPFVLAGRSEDRVRDLARTTGSPMRVGDVSDADLFLAGISGVINTAGPFRDTAPPLMKACIRAGVHYVDVSNEANTHLDAGALDAVARSRGVGIVAGAGFGTWFVERLVHALAGRLDEPVSAHVVTVPSEGTPRTGGVAASQNVVLSTPAVALVNGQLETIRRRVRSFRGQVEPRSAVIVGTGDVIALGKSTGLRTVTVSAGVKVSPTSLRLILPLLLLKARIAASPSSRHAVKRDAADLPASSDEPRVRLFAEVTGSDGARLQGRLSSRSGTAVAAHTAVAVMHKLTSGGYAGTYTAFEVLGQQEISGPEATIEIDASSAHVDPQEGLRGTKPSMAMDRSTKDCTS